MGEVTETARHEMALSRDARATPHSDSTGY